MARLVEALEPGGLMLHATFGPQTFQELFAVIDHVEADRWLTPGQRGLSLRSAEQWAGVLRAGGMVGVEATSNLVRREYEDCRACLLELRGTGAAYSPGMPQEPAVLSEVIRRYDVVNRAPGGVYATYEVIELAAHKPLAFPA